MKRQQAAAVAAVVALGASLLTGTAAQATDDDPAGPRADYAAVSPDGRTIVFVAPTGDTANLWLANRDGSQRRLLSEWRDAVQTEPDWSADGRSIVFASNRGSRHFQIWTIRTDGSFPKQLTADGKNGQPRWSPDASRIAFVSSRTGKGELWLMQSNGADQRAITAEPWSVRNPSWSPDGRSLVYSGCRLPAGGDLSAVVCNLFAVSAHTGVVAALTRGDDVCDESPDWGRAGIVFSGSRGRTPGLWLLNPADNTLVRLPSTATALSWHPRWDRSSGAVMFTRGDALWSRESGGPETLLLQPKP